MQERLALSYLALAETEDWLDGRPSGDGETSLAPTAPAERQIEAA